MAKVKGKSSKRSRRKAAKHRTPSATKSGFDITFPQTAVTVAFLGITVILLRTIKAGDDLLSGGVNVGRDIWNEFEDVGAYFDDTLHNFWDFIDYNTWSPGEIAESLRGGKKWITGTISGLWGN